MIPILGQQTSQFTELIELQSIDCIKPKNQTDMKKTGGKPTTRPGGNGGGKK